MLRVNFALAISTAMTIGMAAYLTRQATTSPAVTIVQNPGHLDLFSTSTPISNPINVARIASPEANATLARPNDGSSYSALASGGPTARAPHDAQPRRRSPLTFAPQEGQMIK